MEVAALPDHVGVFYYRLKAHNICKQGGNITFECSEGNPDCENIHGAMISAFNKNPNVLGDVESSFGPE